MRAGREKGEGGELALLCDLALFIGKNPSLDGERFWRYTDEFGMLRFA